MAICGALCFFFLQKKKERKKERKKIITFDDLGRVGASSDCEIGSLLAGELGLASVKDRKRQRKEKEILETRIRKAAERSAATEPGTKRERFGGGHGVV